MSDFLERMNQVVAKTGGRDMAKVEKPKGKADQGNISPLINYVEDEDEKDEDLDR